MLNRIIQTKIRIKQKFYYILKNIERIEIVENL